QHRQHLVAMRLVLPSHRLPVDLALAAVLLAGQEDLPHTRVVGDARGRGGGQPGRGQQQHGEEEKAAHATSLSAVGCRQGGGVAYSPISCSTCGAGYIFSISQRM